MTTSRKKRMSMLDSLAAAGTPAPPTTMMSSNRALRSARDAVDSHTVWELDPASIEDMRPEDRLEPGDVLDLRHAIEANGQTVPILVRRHPSEPERYLLVYGRRRLEAVRGSEKVDKVRALVASMDDDSAVRAQISENMARQDLSFIEKALFAASLVGSGYGSQNQVAEILTVTKSAISMALAVVDMVGEDLIRAIGPAHGIGRPRWEALGKALQDSGMETTQLIDIAQQTHGQAAMDQVLEDRIGDDPSPAAFEAVLAEVQRRQARPAASKAKAAGKSRGLRIDGKRAGTLARSARGLKIEIQNGGFADWLETRAEDVMTELHARWKNGAEDAEEQ